MPNIQSFYCPPEGFFEFTERNFKNRRLRNQDILTLHEHRGHFQKESPEPSFGSSSFDGVTYFLTGYEAYPVFSFFRYRKEYESRIMPPLVTLVDPVEVCGAPDRFEVYQTANRLRPFARRALIILRPFFVFIRVRKPCVLLRGVLCG